MKTTTFLLIFFLSITPLEGFAEFNLELDGDGVSDQPEAINGTNPLDPASSATSFSFDIDDNNTIEPLLDGLLVLRYLFDFQDDSLVEGVVDPEGQRTDAQAITDYLDNHQEELDIDGNGALDPLTDGLLILRYQFGFNGVALVEDAIGAGATRTTAEQIEAYAESPSFSIADYDPLQVVASSQTLLDTSVFDNDRDREIPILIYLPGDASAGPVLLFSHGNGLNRFISSYLGEHWSDRGYIVVAMQHPGSDSASRTNGSLENSILRIEDVSAIIDQLETWDNDSSHSLYGRLDLYKIGMAGHSFGALTTQAVSGQVISYLTEESRDPRIKAALALSPSIEGDGDPADQFGTVDIPWMLMTGTEDGNNVEERLLVYPALPPGGKYELVLFGGEHLAFTDVTTLSFLEMQFTRNPAHYAEITALSTAFWDSWLLNDSSARTWLDGDGALSVL